MGDQYCFFMKRFFGFVLVLAMGVLVFSCKPKEVAPQEYESVLLSDMQFESAFLEDSIARFNIYLPADYAISGKKYPVLYLLHGVTDDHSAWNAKGKVKEITDKAIREGIIEPFIIVMPDGFNCFYINGAKVVDGKKKGNDWENYYWRELRPHIEKFYPVKKGRENTAVAGDSMGGYGAIYYAFNYPSRFGFCYSMSAAVDNMGIFGNKKVPTLKTIFKNRGYNETFYGKLPRLVMECGKSDILAKGYNESTHRFLDSVKFPHTYNRVNGGHDWKFWRGSYERMLPLLATHFGKEKKTEDN